VGKNTAWKGRSGKHEFINFIWNKENFSQQWIGSLFFFLFIRGKIKLLAQIFFEIYRLVKIGILGCYKLVNFQHLNVTPPFPSHA
jgi:hypothetical protein